jgi:hypothetical protein
MEPCRPLTLLDRRDAVRATGGDDCVTMPPATGEVHRASGWDFRWCTGRRIAHRFRLTPPNSWSCFCPARIGAQHPSNRRGEDPKK